MHSNLPRGGRGTVREVLGAMPEATAAVRREGFHALRRGEAVEPAALAEHTSLPVAQVEQALALMVSVGAPRSTRWAGLWASVG